MEAQKAANGEKVIIIADVREDAAKIARLLGGMGVDVRREQLGVGDYICSDRVAVERKTVEDFLSSILNQRIFTQMDGLAAAYQCPVLIIEGDPGLMFTERDISANAIRGALASVAVDYRVPILWTGTPMESASMLHRLAWREQVKDNRGLQVRTNKKAKTLAQRQEFLVAGLPHVSNMLSRRLLKHFGTPQAVFNASVEDLTKVDKIGEKRAKTIRELLSRGYG